MKKIVLLCIASCGLVLASCGGSSASDNPDLIIEKEDVKDSITEPVQSIEDQLIETPVVEEPKMKEKVKDIKNKRKR